MKFKKSTISVIIILVAAATIIGLSGLNFLIPNIGEVGPPKVDENQYMEKFFLTTKDGVKIAANLYKVDNPNDWVVFSHMLPAAKESWEKLARYLQAKGYEGLAFDLRGHGESDGGPQGYLNFLNLE